MNDNKIKTMSTIYFAAALAVLIFCVVDVCIYGLFAPAVDITHGVGVAAICVVCQLAQVAMFIILGLDMLRQITKQTVQTGLLLIIVSLLTLVFCLWGSYIIVPALIGIILPIVTVFVLR
ncbi:MAG: hypothetical protein IKY33_03945 [Clostridia bacterium]|nr:hypothetical protein [Clostridia bacterium]